MIAVIFEVTPRVGKRQAYFNLATEMRPLLDEIDGFISIERFQSLAEPRRILWLSFWRDEAAIEAWRNLEPLRRAQATGRNRMFEAYRLRVAGVVRDYGTDDRDQAPGASRVSHGEALSGPTARSRQSVDLAAT